MEEGTIINKQVLLNSYHLLNSNWWFMTYDRYSSSLDTDNMRTQSDDLIQEIARLLFTINYLVSTDKLIIIAVAEIVKIGLWHLDCDKD